MIRLVTPCTNSWMTMSASKAVCRRWNRPSSNVGEVPSGRFWKKASPEITSSRAMTESASPAPSPPAWFLFWKFPARSSKPRRWKKSCITLHQ
jgi:hypothetical protein